MRHTHGFLTAGLVLLVAKAALAQGTPAPAPAASSAPLPPLPAPAPASGKPAPATTSPAPTATPPAPPPPHRPATRLSRVTRLHLATRPTHRDKSHRDSIHPDRATRPAPPGQAYPQPGYYPPPFYQPQPMQPIPPPGPPPNAHTHSGFFLRMSGGVGYMSDSSQISGLGDGKVVARGGGLVLGLDIGGALNPGLIVAASFSFQSLPNPNISTDTRLMPTPRNPQLSMLALMGDFYPDPKTGFHVGGALGLAGLSQRQDSSTNASNNDESGSGFGFLPHVGYEWWVGNYWGVGVMGRFLYARTKSDLKDGTTAKDSVVGSSISFTATYN